MHPPVPAVGSAIARCLAPSPFIVLTGHIVHHIELQDLGGANRGEDAGGREEAQDIQHDPKRRQPAICSVPPASGLPIAKMTARVSLIAGTQKWRFASPIPPPTVPYQRLLISGNETKALQNLYLFHFPPERVHGGP